MPLGVKSKSKDIWNGILENCEKKLSNWKSNYFKYIRRNFLWEGNNKKKKFHPVKWDSFIVNKRKGGLGIKNLKIQNNSLLMKWLWKFAANELTLWKAMILDKYEREGKWTTKCCNESYGISLWKSIRNLWPMLKEKSSIKIVLEQCKDLFTVEDSLRRDSGRQGNLLSNQLMRKGVNSNQEERWKVIPGCIWWTIWEERNKRCFKNKSSHSLKIKLKCWVLMYFRCKGTYIEDHDSIFVVLDSL
ncbi:unnamed protein product [Withania somnifera]